MAQRLRQKIKPIKILSKNMAKVIYIDPIKSISGKLSKKSKVCYMVRTAPTSNVEMQNNPNYTTICGKRSTLPSASELAQRTRFGSIYKATQTRLKDPSKMQADLAAFKQQTEYQTIRQYVWHQCAEEQA